MTKLSLLDGAIGSELILRGETLPSHIWSAEVNLSNPDLLLNIYKEYINAGSNYITTNTFRTT
ncbi:MAG: homocysteine S-methyltransferase family protein, partial [Candidatus Marinimicrobia bacterium]|nr:homocysteine S-methyltransferase family protein [Candidatus Neomarinimicrobiota bacterium]